MSFPSMLYSFFLMPIQLIFELIYSLAYRSMGNDPGLAIIALSLAMNLLVLPLYRRADAMQEEERVLEAKLHDGVAHIKKTFHGDERTMILQTYYRQNNYSPLYVLRSAVSLLLEIPFFIAAYRFLSGLSLLQGVSFGPISDLGKPDGLLSIAGISINILPVIMTVINLISTYIFTKGYPLKTKIQLYGMAVFFLVFVGVLTLLFGFIEKKLDYYKG
jgi:membrane protein insertase Oxa1/YidC/SpoIIIJ